MIEIIIVVALIAFVYTVALPQLNQRSGAEAAQKMAQLSGDVRSAYDLSVLTGKVYRLVFKMADGDYWLEEADRTEVYLGSEKLDRDFTEQEEKDEKEAFDTKMAEYVDLAGQEVVDPKGDKKIPPVSPVVSAKDKLKRPAWAKIENLEWQKRTLGPYYMIRDMQSEHHGQKQDFSELGAEARAMIYFFPNGYVQRAYIHVAPKLDDMKFDEDPQKAYTIVTNPWEGTAEVRPGYEEVDVHADKEGS